MSHIPYTTRCQKKESMKKRKVILKLLPKLSKEGGKHNWKNYKKKVKTSYDFGENKYLFNSK